MTYKIGLTGLIGSGKSLAASYFIRLGVEVIDTDTISHSITSSQGLAIPEIEKVFGQDYLDEYGALDRDKMRSLIFSHPEEKIKLESILHPLIFDEVVNSILNSKGLYTIIVVPLLFQSPRYAKYIQKSIFIDCNEEILISRVMVRNNFSRDMVLKILDNQLPRNRQLKLADDVLVNNGTPEHLEQQIIALDEKYKELLNNT